MKPVEVKIWLLRQGIRQVDIARELGVHKVTVNKTINGHERNRRVIRWLRERGCPEEFLGGEERRAA